ncbi:hypothetical protein JW948_09615 [bacterium]|nr:hypothetical protein [bacterium]
MARIIDHHRIASGNCEQDNYIYSNRPGYLARDDHDVLRRIWIVPFMKIRSPNHEKANHIIIDPGHVVLPCCFCPGEYADMIIMNANIITVDAKETITEAVVVKERFLIVEEGQQ